MKQSSLVGHLVELFDLVRNSSAPVDRFLRSYFRSRRYLGARDRRFINEHLYGMVRHARMIEHLAGPASGSAPTPPGLDPFLPYLIYAIVISHRPSEEVVNELTDLPGSPGLQDLAGSLSRIDPAETLPADPVRRGSILYSMPEFVVREWFARFGESGGGQLCAAMNAEAPVTLRVNTLKTTREECVSELRREGIDAVTTSLSPEGIIIPGRENLQALTSYRQGMFEVQDEGSQLVSYVVGPAPGETVIDACGGAGGKALHMAARMQNRGTIVSVEPDHRRAAELAVRSRRAGASIISQVVPEDRGLERFVDAADRVLVDAPCSGSGVFRRNPGAKLRLREDDVELYAREQGTILRSYARLVRPGGRLIYATCSLLSRENEEVVHGFLRDVPGFAVRTISRHLSQSLLSLAETNPFLILTPHHHGTDGFFCAVLERVDS